MSKAKVVPQEPTRSEVSPSEAPSENSNTESLSSDMAGIEYPGKHDVKLGRGGDANSHIGNIKFRQLISQYKPRYIAASRSNKPFVAEEVVQIWRNLDPPGRFLIRTDPSLGDDSTWHDVGDRRARKKASQALREKDRSEDLVASLAHHGQMGIPGMAAMAPSLAPAMAQAHVAGGHAASSNMVAAAAAAMAAAANEQSRKRAREQDMASILGGDRRVAPRQDGTPGIDPVAAARALQQLLQPQGSALAAPAPPAPVPAPAAPVAAQAPPAEAPAQAPSSVSGLDALLLPALQLLLQQKQQEQQQQQQQTLSSLAAVFQSLVSPNQSNQAQQSSAGRSQPTDQLAAALSSLLGASAPNQPAAAAPAPLSTGASQPAAAAPVPNLFAQAAQLAGAPASSGSAQPAAAAPVPSLFAQAPSSQFASAAPSQPASGQSQGQNLDRLLATRIIENLIGSSTTQQRTGL